MNVRSASRAILPGLAVLCVLSGLLPGPDLAELWARIWPILLFVTSMTVVTDLLFTAGVFERVIGASARLARGRTFALWLVTVLLAVVCTVFFSLDTTAVLLTPLVVLLARRTGLPPLPFAVTIVWLANTASLLLPVSNLTNLLVQERLGISPVAFAGLVWAPAIVGIAVPCAVVFLIFRRRLTGRFSPAPARPVDDPVLLRAGYVVLALLLPALVSGVPVALSATVAAVALVCLFAVRRRSALTLRLIPANPLLLALSLFVLVTAAHAQGLDAFLAPAAGHGEDVGSLLQLALAGAAGANAVNNLPAYLALEPSGTSPLRLAALLIGVNLGPLITPWGSLATLLWAERLRSLGITIRWVPFALAGLLVTALMLPAAVAVLSWAGG
ncbi:arsenic transporter [Arthrobacter agilis]|uniref:SLC13 family permease n=1 Tax=Arthrobacter agilis TaxID=37921 RepID=UPI000B34E170|nr:SLC13 family permease [Arthrobacter agilis]OUM41628.1 arsenic transporter [Arthrobacter agilis]PPB47205.1 arsenic transporter [Arthrobacter agilis]TPV26797.1 arsenic transporter [Arthrobacter agilis]VDR33093.1 Arsenic efflux pump protein [Arthrobacter agilis]